MQEAGLQVPEESLGRPISEENETVPPDRETILLVEDEPLVRSFLRSILAEAGYTVLEAGSGADVKVLFMSGHAGEAIAEHGLDDGKLLRKPSPLDAILRKVREALDR